MNNLDSKKHGSTIPNITKSDIEELQILLPSLEKQKEIVLYCDEIDATIKLMESRIKSNEMLMKNIMETYLKTNNENIKDSENKSDTESSESDKIIETKPVKKINKKIVKKMKSSEEDSINSSESESKEDDANLKSSSGNFLLQKNPKKELVKKTK